MADQSSLTKKRVRDALDEPEFDSLEVKRLREELLQGNLDEIDLFATSSDLDLFIKSFEKEISPATITVVDLTEDSSDSESRQELGFLFGASDDELGIPPVGEERVLTELEPGLSESWRYESDQYLPSYDRFEYEHGYNMFNNDLEYEYLDSGLDFYDAPLPLWRSETMSGL